MRPSPTRDLVVGLFVLVGIVGVAYLSLSIGGVSWKSAGGLEIKAVFDDIGGLKVRSPVVISGVRVGQVTAIGLDKTLRGEVTFQVDPGIELAEDTFASIRTSGLLGDQFVNLEPGGSDVTLKSGETIAFTQGALALEKLIDRFVTNVDKGESK